MPVFLTDGPEVEQSESLVYEGRVKSKPSIREVWRRIVDKEIPTPEPGEILNRLYPKSDRRAA